MKTFSMAAVAVACLTLGIGIGFAAKRPTGPGMEIISGKTPKEAGMAALQEAETLAGEGTWELIAIARVYALSGDKNKGQQLIDKVLAGKNDRGDWQRIGQYYADTGNNAKAEEFFLKTLAADPKDDSGQAEIGAWYIRTGQRAKGEELLAKAFAKHPDEIWHYMRAAEGFLNVPTAK
jgi:tetratricopeptide (TPR) repeat protein